jgi:hypothetical protein
MTQKVVANEATCLGINKNLAKFFRQTAHLVTAALLVSNEYYSNPDCRRRRASDVPTWDRLAVRCSSAVRRMQSSYQWKDYTSLHGTRGLATEPSGCIR